MARPALVVDASVGVKWFSTQDEGSLPQALQIRDAHVEQQVLVMVPDIFYHEVVNALIHKRSISDDEVQLAVTTLFGIQLETVPVSASLMAETVRISRDSHMSAYDACYVAVARSLSCPLVTANPRHGGRGPGCRVIPLEQWPQESP